MAPRLTRTRSHATGRSPAGPSWALSSPAGPTLKPAPPWPAFPARINYVGAAEIGYFRPTRHIRGYFIRAAVHIGACGQPRG